MPETVSGRGQNTLYNPAFLAIKKSSQATTLALGGMIISGPDFKRENTSQVSSCNYLQSGIQAGAP